MTTPIPKPVCGGQTQVLVDATSELIDLNWSAANVTELRTIEPAIDGQRLDLDGHTDSGIGGGEFFYKASDSGADNNGTRIVTAGGKSWIRGNVQSVTPQMFGWLSSITDHTDILINTHSAGKPVWYGEYDYIVKRPNEILLVDGIGYAGENATITVPSDATAPDSGDGFGRFNNNVFYRNSTAGLLKPIVTTGITFKIERDKWNGIGAGVIAIGTRDDSTAGFYVYENQIDNFGIANDLGATSTFSSGALCDVRGYILHVYNNVANDCGNAVYCSRSKLAHIYDNEFNFCGVSRDFTTWSNVSCITSRGSEIHRIYDNKITVTGGSSIFCSDDTSEILESTKEVHVYNNQLTGCGLSAISGGFRSYVTIQKHTDLINIYGNTINGWCCSIGGDEHTAIKIAVEDGNNSTVGKIYTNNVVNYLAPWETFNYTDNDVDGSYNINKTKGFDVGSQNGVQVSADSTAAISEAIIKDTVSNHQRIGISAFGIHTCNLDVITKNCGWSKQSVAEGGVNNDAFQVQQSVSVNAIEILITKAVVSEQSLGVNANNSFCTVIKATDIQDHTLDLTVTASDNQTRAFRLVNNVAAYELSIEKLNFDNPSNDAGYIGLIDISSGSATDDTVLTWINPQEVVVATSGRTLPVGTKSVAAKYSMGFGLVTTLEPAAFYNKTEIEFSANAAQTHTVTPDGTDTIDGSNSSLVIPAGQSVKLVSIGGEWLSTRTIH